MSESKLLFRIEEAADALSLSRARVYELIQEGRLRTLKIGGSRRVASQDLDDFVERLRTGAGGAVEREPVAADTGAV
jgi:excisionase family DNA binding protein